MVKFYSSDAITGNGVASGNSISKKFNKKNLIDSSDIENNGLEWAMMDDFNDKLKQNTAIIVNTDINGGGGIHWVVMYLRGNVLYLIDSLGNKNYRPNDKHMRNIINENNLILKIYPFGSYQYSDDSLCGWFSIYIANKINENQPKDVFKYVYSLFGNTPDDNDIKKLMNGFGLTGNGQMDKKLD